MRIALRGIILLFLLSLSAVASAQQNAPASAPPAEDLTLLTPAERAELLSRLSDTEVRALLAEYLNVAARRPEPPVKSVIERLEAQSERFQENFSASVRSAPEIAVIPALVYQRMTAGRGPLHPFTIILLLGALLAVSYAGERIFLRTLATPRSRLAAIGPDADFLSRSARIAGLLLLDLLGLAMFAAITLTLFLLLYRGHEPTRLFVLTTLSAIVIFRTVIIASRAAFGRRNSSLRLVPVGGVDARIAHRHTMAAGAIATFGFLGCDLLQTYGVGQAPLGLLRLILGTLFIATIAVGVWRLRRGIGGAIMAEAAEDGLAGTSLQTAASLWHVPVILYLVGVYGMAVFNGFSGAVSGIRATVSSILLIAVLPLAVHLLRGFLDRLLGPKAGADEATSRIFRRAANILVGLVAIFILAEIWGADIFDLAGAGIGGRIVRAMLDIALTGLVGYVAWGFLSAALARHMPEDTGREVGVDEGGGTGTTRAGTVLPLFKRFAQIAIVVIVLMVALSALGVNIGPLLAGAGIIGIAVGFGAQTLVRDLVSGLFFLIDDAFRRGEYVDLGGIKGTVERINMRSMVLRHHLGPLHTVPYGEITHLTNYSRDWVIMKLEFRVGYDTDVDRIKKIFKRIGREMLEDPEMGKNFIEPFKSQGVKAMEESAMIVRGKFMAKPGTQFQIRKEIYNRVQKAFKENGIEFAHRRVTVDLPTELDLPTEKEKELRKAAGAAAMADTAVDQQ